ncbi:hypothetical protein KEM55_005620 [Ascosphaera atra]|nr:hypothetical protein KEM55_005620 [Ascosphaera atra]
MVWWKRDLADPGSSTYDSNMLHVGDGTWDSGRDTYLLPPLMGVNFETMRYNGMGNRFKDDHNYKQLIAAHAVLAAIVFLFLIPPSIFVARFYTRQPYWAKRIHIGLQILSMFLLTASFVTGWFAVSPERRLTNPHHGIGLAIYVLMWFNMFCGWGVYLKLRGKSMMHSAFIAMFHRWIGRALALLGLAQIPLGLTLYGSPKALFILYALVVFTLLCLYFLLSYLEERRLAPEYSSTTTTTSTSPKHDGLPGPANATSHSGSDQSHTDRRRTRPTRYAEPAAAGAGAGAGAGVMGKIFGSNGPNYAPAPSQERPDRYDDSRLEEGRHAAHGAAQEQTELTEQDSEWDHHEHSHEHSHEHDHTGAKMVVGAGALYALSRFWKKRRARKGQKAEDVAEMRMVGDTETETQGLTRRASGRTARSQSRFRRGNSVGSSGEGSDSQTESGYTYGADGSRVTASNLTGDEISAIPNPKRRSRATGAEADDLSDAPNSRRRVSGKKHAGPADSAATTTTRTTTTTTSDSGQNVTLHLRKPRDNDNGQVTLRKLTPEEAAAKKKSKRSKGKDRDRERERRHRRGGSDDSGRRSSRSRSRPAVKHSGGAVFAGGPPSALNTISEVSTEVKTVNEIHLKDRRQL